MPPVEEAQNPAKTPIKREISLALALLFGVTFCLLGVGLALPSVGAASQGLLAFALLLIPSFVLRKSSVRVDDLGVAMSPWRPTLKLAGLTMLVIFTLFTAGYHVYQTAIQDRAMSYDVANLAEYRPTLQSTPFDPCTKATSGLGAWVDGPPYRLWIVGPPNQAVSLRMTPPATGARLIHCEPREGEAHRVTASGQARPRGEWLRSGRHRRGLMVHLGERDSFKADLHLRGRDLEPGALRVGEALETVETLEGTRSAWWIILFTLTQILLVAFPEEWFFRGYLQTRLDQWLGTRWKILGADLGWGWILAAAAFACLHPILIPGVHRLLVFFPALLFGWLRARGGNIGAAVIVHAGSNVLLAVLTRMAVV